jgi:hypothetical protein
MAEKLKIFKFKGNHGGKYPWDDWFDGGIWKLRHGKDFNCQVANFRTGASHAARKHGGRLKTSVIEGESAVVIQFIKENGKG